MLKKAIALGLILALLLAALPSALASDSVSANTPLDGASADKRANIRLAAQAIDGVKVPSGGSFSFNETVGPRTKRRGYRTAPNGRGVKVTGGGVAQVATTLYLALLKLGSGVRIDPVKTYGSRFVDDYVSDPDYAIVTDYDAGIDLSFVNRGEDLSIDLWTDDDGVWCVITTGKVTGFSFLDDVSDSQDDRDFDFDDDDGVEYGESVYSALSQNVPLLYIEPEGDGAYYDDDDDDDDDEGQANYIASVLPASGGGRVLLGEARINCGGDPDVLHNVGLAADCVNDTALESGDKFSFNDVVGPRTRKYGYRLAINGRGVKVTGGGVAQVASALWLAIKDSDDFAVIEKSTYGKKYNQHYVKNAADAIITDYSSGRDFCFRYTGSESVTIYTYVSDGWLYCDIYEH